MQKALEDALGDLILGAAVDPDDASAVADWLERHHVAESDRQAIVAQGVRRLLVYRRLVRNGLRGALEVSIPRTLARLGEVFDEYFDRFLAEVGPRTHYLRDVPREFLEFCAEPWRADPRVAPYLFDLAQHEFLRIEVGAMPISPPRAELPQLELDRALAFVETARVVRYAHCVHELPDDEDDRSEPRAEPTQLFVYRSAEHVVRYLELTPMAASVLERLVAGSTLRQALTDAAQAHRLTLDQSVLNGTARVLADLADRGALVGARGTR